MKSEKRKDRVQLRIDLVHACDKLSNLFLLETKRLEKKVILHFPFIFTRRTTSGPVPVYLYHFLNILKIVNGSIAYN